MKVANSMKVFRHDMLKGDDVHQWRFDTYQNLGVQKNYSLRDIRLLNAQFPTEQTVISTMMKEKENQSECTHSPYRTKDTEDTKDTKDLASPPPLPYAPARS